MKRNLWALLVCVPVVLLSLNLSADTANTDQASVVIDDNADTMNAAQGDLNLNDGATNEWRRWGRGWGGWGGYWGGYGGYWGGYGGWGSYVWPYYGGFYW